jgi:hypothetical protein
MQSKCRLVVTLSFFFVFTQIDCRVCMYEFSMCKTELYSQLMRWTARVCTRSFTKRCITIRGSSWTHLRETPALLESVQKAEA